MKFRCHGARGSRPISFGKNTLSRVITKFLLTEGSEEIVNIINNSFEQSKGSLGTHLNPQFSILDTIIKEKIEKENLSNLGMVTNTPCIEVKSSAGKGDEQIIFDLGTGASEIEILENTKVLHIFFTHFHYDHVQGMPFVAALYNPNITVNFYSPVIGFERYLHALMHHPYFPVKISEVMTKKMYFHTLQANTQIRIAEFIINWMPINHPGGCYAYKITNNKSCFSYFSDVSINEILFNPTREHRKFLEGIDAMVLDSSMSFEDSVTKRYFGHTNFYIGIDFAHYWDIKSIYFFHYDPSDDIQVIPALYQCAQWYKKIIDAKVSINLAQEEKWIDVKLANTQ